MWAEEPPPELTCPTCLRVALRAVSTPAGVTLCEACAVRGADARGVGRVGRCPLTRAPLSAADLRPNLVARTLVDDLWTLCPHGVRLVAPPPGAAPGAARRGWEPHPDGCPARLRWGLRSAHLASCPHAPVTCPRGGTACGPLARMDVDDHLEAECERGAPGGGGGWARGLAEGNAERASAARLGLVVALGAAALLWAGATASRTWGPAVRDAAGPLAVLVGGPVALVAASLWLERAAAARDAADRLGD